MHTVRHLFWSTCLAAAIGVVLETDVSGGLVTMSLAAAVAAVVGHLGFRVQDPASNDRMAAMSAATLGGSLGALAVVVLAWMTGRAIGGGMVAMLWMAGGMGGMVGASLTCRHPSGSPGFRR